MCRCNIVDSTDAGMKMDRDSSKNQKQTAEVTTSQANVAEKQESQVTRRRALIVGLAAVPAVMSITRRSVWGNEAGPNCSIVASYVNGGYHFTSPNLPGHTTPSRDDIEECSRRSL